MGQSEEHYVVSAICPGTEAGLWPCSDMTRPVASADAVKALKHIDINFRTT